MQDPSTDGSRRPSATSLALRGTATSTTASSARSAVVHPSVRFTTVDELLYAINNATGDILYVQGVSKTDFKAIEKALEEKLRFQCFIYDLKLLIIKIPTRTHESLFGLLWHIIMIKIDRIGLMADWDGVGATDFVGPTSTRQPDQCGIPVRQRPEHDAWPTIIIEAGYSQSYQALKATAEQWFRESRHQVKIVLIIRLYKTQRQILLEKYEEEEAPPRDGARSRSITSSLQPRLQQRITITRSIDEDRQTPSSYNVSDNASLELSFSQLFLREPEAGEHDIIIGPEDLKQIAVKVWRAVGA